jgi:competence protein ComEC
MTKVLGQLEIRSIWLIFLTLFIPLYLFKLHSIPIYQIPEDTEIRLRGRLTQQPYLKDSQQIIYLGPIMIVTDRFPGYFYGQKLEVFGRFEKEVTNFFQVRYFAYFPRIRLIEEPQFGLGTAKLMTILIKVRGRIEKGISRLLPEPHSSLLLGILFGIKHQMPEEFLQNLRKTGTLHIVVASGQNVTLVARFLILLLVWLISRRWALILAVVGVVFYILMVGAEAPVVRAGIMATLAFMAQFLGREEEGTIALLVAAAAMLLISPLIIFDIGFQLSFMATAGILWLYPLLVKRGKRIFQTPILGESLAMTLAAQLGVMPILLANFGQISVLSPLINTLVLWIVPLVMVLGTVLALFSLVINPLAQLLSWFLWVLLTYFVKVINLAGVLPWISWETGQLSLWWAVGYYLVLGYFLWRERKSVPRDF